MPRRRPLPLLAVPAAVALLGAAPGTAPASSYCSPTGDYCHAATKRDGVVRLVLNTFSFTGRVQVCVTPPSGARTCRSFRLTRREGGVLGIDAKWSAHFPRAGAGTYRVRFRWSGNDLGDAVTFSLKR